MSLDRYRLEHLVGVAVGVAVAEEGSITRAAARRHLSLQALSTSVRALEREVGVPLLGRSGLAVTLPAADRAPGLRRLPRRGGGVKRQDARREDTRAQRRRYR